MVYVLTCGQARGAACESGTSASHHRHQTNQRCYSGGWSFFQVFFFGSLGPMAPLAKTASLLKKVEGLPLQAPLRGQNISGELAKSGPSRGEASGSSLRLWLVSLVLCLCFRPKSWLFSCVRSTCKLEFLAP